MKTRNGFVSNSSSSSFIIRGVRVKKNELAELLKVKVSDYGDFNVEEYGDDFSCRDTRYFFGGEKTDDIIVGMSFNVDDGTVVEIEDNEKRDKEIIDGLKKMGLDNIKLSTFFQYVSNDNY